MDLDGKTNKLEHKTQLIEIDKLLINIPNETQNKIKRESKRTGVLHQVIQPIKLMIFNVLFNDKFPPNIKLQKYS